MDLDRGHSILTAADYVIRGNSSGTVEFHVVTKDDIGENRLALDAFMTTVKGTMTNHAAVCVQSVVLIVRKTSATDHAVSSMTDLCSWTGRNMYCSYNVGRVLFLSKTSRHPGEKQAKILISRSSRSDHGCDAVYCVGEEQRAAKYGTVRVISSNGRENETIQVASCGFSVPCSCIVHSRRRKAATVTLRCYCCCSNRSLKHYI